MEQIKRFIIENKKELLIIMTLLFFSAAAHAANMFHFPYYEDDEGTYMAQAWSLLTQGKLAPYTYFYDHAPAGWIFIAIWTIFTGGFFTFGTAINSGRVFMLLLHLSSCIFIYLIARRMTANKWISALSVLIFSLSPLSIYFQRRVLLDNIMIFWVLLSLTLLLYSVTKRQIVLSAIAIGIGVLTKENAIIFIPVFLYIIFLRVAKGYRLNAYLSWGVPVIGIIMLYVLYALIRGEFFPYGGIFGGQYMHVSLIGTLQEQMKRAANQGSFAQVLNIWLNSDPIIIVLGGLATIFNFFIGLKDKAYRIISLLSIVFWLFLIRGGVVLEFYLVPLIPLLALNIVFSIWFLQNWFTKYKTAPIIIFGLFYLLTFFLYSDGIKGKFNLFSSDQTTPQRQAVDWILTQNAPNSFYMIDNYAYVDLHAKAKPLNFSHAEYYWKVDTDLDISDKILHNDPKNINFIAMTPQMKADLDNNPQLKLGRAALANSILLKSFWKDDWGVEIRQNKM